MSLRSILDAIARYVLSLLTFTFTSESSRRRAYPSSSNDHTGKQDIDATLDEAFAAFGLLRSEAVKDLSNTRSLLDKAKRKLSHVHHPDRNLDNKESATEKMKDLNAKYDICRELLDLLEGEAGGRRDAGHHAREDEDTRRDSSSNRRSKEQAEGVRRGTERKDREEEERDRSAEDQHQRREFEKQRRTVDEEVRRMWRRQQQQQQRQEQQQQQQQGASSASSARRKGKKKRNSRNYSTFCPPDPAVLRQRAHIMWLVEVAAFIQGRQEPSETSLRPHGGPKPCPTKPAHQTLDSSTNTIAVALRVGSDAVALSEIRTAALLLALRHGRVPQPSDMPWLIKMVLTRGLDDDGNTTMHYVSYYENDVLFILLMMELGPFFVDVLLHENIRRQIPADFCAVWNSGTFKDRIDIATRQARKVVNDRRLSAKVWKFLQAMDLFRVAHFAGSVVLIGRTAFQRGWLLSIILAFSSRSHCIFCIASHAVLSHVTPSVSATDIGLALLVLIWLCFMVAGVFGLKETGFKVVRIARRGVSTIKRLGQAIDELLLLPWFSSIARTESQKACIELLVCSAVLLTF